LNVFEETICTCVIQICLIPYFVLLVGFFLIFVLFLSLGQEAQQIMCGATSLGQQAYLLNLLETFNMHLIL
jgi:positive regulator of sigma E activity